MTREPDPFEYQDTAVGRLPVGPAGDAALAAAAAARNGAEPLAEPRQAQVTDRGAVLKRAVPAIAAATGVAITVVVLWRRNHA